MVLLVGDDELGAARGNLLDDPACLLRVAGEPARNLIPRPMVKVLECEFGGRYGVLHIRSVAEGSPQTGVLGAGFTGWTHELSATSFAARVPEFSTHGEKSLDAIGPTTPASW